MGLCLFHLFDVQVLLHLRISQALSWCITRGALFRIVNQVSTTPVLLLWFQRKPQLVLEWPSDIFGRLDSWNYIASLFSSLLLCSCFMYMRSQLMYMYLIVNPSLLRCCPIRLCPPPSPFASKGCITSVCFFCFSLLYFTADPAGSSKILKCLSTVLFPRYPEPYLRSTQDIR